MSNHVVHNYIASILLFKSICTSQKMFDNMMSDLNELFKIRFNDIKTILYLIHFFPAGIDWLPKRLTSYAVSHILLEKTKKEISFRGAVNAMVPRFFFIDLKIYGKRR